MKNHINQYSAIFAIAIPMIISNITTPLLGLVDTAVVGHLEHHWYLGGVSVGAMIFTFIYWLAGFLRMSTTGMTAQAVGANDSQQSLSVLLQGLIIALVISVCVLVIQQPLLQLGLHLASASEQVTQYAAEYFSIRIWAMPAALANLVLMGWLLANQHTTFLMWTQIAVNLLNILLDLLFVLVFEWDVQGVALASVIVEYSALVIYLHKANGSLGVINSIKLKAAWQAAQFGKFLSVNRDILIRTLLLEICFAFITFKGASLGDNIVAANAVLINFLLLISLGLDGIAYAAEVLVGKAYGANKMANFRQTVQRCLVMNTIFAVVYTAIFLLFGSLIIGLMTDITIVREAANDYLIYIILLPIVACWCFLFDGIFIGLSDSKSMRNSMFVSVVAVYFPVWYGLSHYDNHALWIALLALMLARGFTLGWKLNFYISRGFQSLAQTGSPK